MASRPSAWTLRRLVLSADSPRDLLETLFVHYDVSSALGFREGTAAAAEAIRVFPRAFDSPDIVCRAFFKLSDFNDSENMGAKSLRACRDALKAAVSAGDEFYEAQCLSRLGLFFKKYSSRPPVLKRLEREFARSGSFRDGMNARAAELFRESAEIFGRLGHAYNHGVSIFNHALMLWACGRQEESYAAAADARERADRAGSGALLAEILLHIANIHSDRREFYMARTYYRASIDLFRGDGNWPKASDVMHKMAWVFLMEGDSGSALSAYKKALDMKVSVDFMQARGDSMMGRGMSLRSVGSLRRAASCFAAAAPIFEAVRLSDYALLAKYFLYRTSVACGGEFSPLSLNSFMKSYRPGKVGLPVSPGLVYEKRAGDSDPIDRPFGMPPARMRITRRNLHDVLRDASSVCWKRGDRLSSAFLSKKAGILAAYRDSC